MKIVIISDIHDNLVNLKKFLSWVKKNKIEEIICCGDVTNAETLNILASNFKSKIHLVRGNIELYEEIEVKKYNNIKYYSRAGRVKINNRFIGICHEPYNFQKVLEKGEVEIIFYGHTHKPWINEFEYKNRKIKTINPGTLGGVFQKGTFAFWDTENKIIKLKILERL